MIPVSTGIASMLVYMIVFPVLAGLGTGVGTWLTYDSLR